MRQKTNLNYSIVLGLFMVAVLWSCSLKRNQAPTTANSILSVNDLGMKYCEAIIKTDLRNLQPYMMSPIQARKVAPEQTKNISDDSISNVIISPMKAQFILNLSGLRMHLTKNGMEVSKLKVASMQAQKISTSNEGYYVLTIVATDGRRESSIPLTFIKGDSQPFIIEMASSRPHVRARKE